MLILKPWYFQVRERLTQRKDDTEERVRDRLEQVDTWASDSDSDSNDSDSTSDSDSDSDSNSNGNSNTNTNTTTTTTTTNTNTNSNSDGNSKSNSIINRCVSKSVINGYGRAHFITIKKNHIAITITIAMPFILPLYCTSASLRNFTTSTGRVMQSNSNPADLNPKPLTLNPEP